MPADFKQSANLAGKILASGCVNPNYQISFTGIPTGGTFTPLLTSGVNGPTPNAQSVAITYTATLTAAAVQTALQALTGFSGVTVTGSNGGPFTVVFPGGIGVCTLTVTSALTGGTVPIASVAGVGVDTTFLPAITAATAVKVATCSVTNAAAGAGTLSVSVVPSGGSVDGTHRVVSNYPLAANDSTKITEVENGFYDAGALFSLNCTQPVTYLITGAVSS